MSQESDASLPLASWGLPPAALGWLQAGGDEEGEAEEQVPEAEERDCVRLSGHRRSRLRVA